MKMEYDPYGEACWCFGLLGLGVSSCPREAVVVVGGWRCPSSREEGTSFGHTLTTLNLSPKMMIYPLSLSHSLSATSTEPHRGRSMLSS